MKLTATTSFHSLLVIPFLLLLTLACNKESLQQFPAEETATLTNIKSNTNGCATITSLVSVPSEVSGNYWLQSTLAWANQGGRKYIQVYPVSGTPFFVDASASTGIYSWNQQVESLYGIFTIRTVTYTGGSPGEGSICQDQYWSLVVDPVE